MAPVPTAKKGRPIARNHIARILLPTQLQIVQRHLEVTRMEYHMVIPVEGYIVVAKEKQQVQ
jgi:hypothetical protein